MEKNKVGKKDEWQSGIGGGEHILNKWPEKVFKKKKYFEKHLKVLRE